jgi:hypothetical protein
MTESINSNELGYAPIDDFLKCFNIYAKKVYEQELERAKNPEHPDIIEYSVTPPLVAVRLWESPFWSGGDYGSQAILKVHPNAPLFIHNFQPTTKEYYNIQVGAQYIWQELGLKLTLELIGSGEQLTLQQEKDFYKAVNIVSNFLPMTVGSSKQLQYDSYMLSPLSPSIEAPLKLKLHNPTNRILPVMVLESVDSGGFESVLASKHGGQVGGLANKRSRLFQEYSIKLLIKTKKPVIIDLGE